MSLTKVELYEALTKLIRLATYLLGEGGTFTHAQNELEYQDLRSNLPAKVNGELAAELRALAHAVDVVVSKSGAGAQVLADLQAARDGAVRLLARDEYRPLRGPLRSGFTD